MISIVSQCPKNFLWMLGSNKYKYEMKTITYLFAKNDVASIHRNKIKNIIFDIISVFMFMMSIDCH